MISKRPSITRILVRRSSSDDIMLESNDEFLNKSFDEDSHQTNKDHRLKHVSFCEEVVMSEILHHRNYTEDERAHYWYTASELMESNYSKEISVNLFKEGILKTDTKEFSLRGIEHRTIDTGKRRRRDKTRLAVLKEQQYQRSQGFSNPEAVMACYVAANEPCRIKARRYGMMDEIAVFGVESTARDETTQPKETRKRRKITSSKAITTLHHVWSLLHLDQRTYIQLTCVV
mmetsp:Transcript_18574/g.28082  ORF Transcript_18574/g.28082 Transcript_18574/m.28082 type:complete len:231 (-) Transcript_18574:279-971(-)